MKVFPKIFFQAPQEVERLSTDRKVSGSLPGSSCQHVEEILGEILNPDSPPSWCHCMCGEGDRNICARDKHIYENISYHGVHFVLLKSEETTAGGRYLHVFKKWGGQTEPGRSAPSVHSLKTHSKCSQWKSGGQRNREKMLRHSKFNKNWTKNLLQQVLWSD